MSALLQPVLRRRRVQETCSCAAYRFPHRAGSGTCRGDQPGPFCGSCGEPCDVTSVDFGIGAYEYWGSKGVDRNVQTVSDCCEATVFKDAALRREWEED